MAGKFVLTAEINLRAPKDLARVAAQIRKALGGVDVEIRTTGTKKTAADLKKVETQTKKTAAAAAKAKGSFNRMGRALSEAVTHIAKYDVARRIVVAFSNALSGATSDAIKFERELIKVAQVTDRTLESLSGLKREIRSLAKGLGVSSSSLVKTSRILAQTGMTAEETTVALRSLAKTQLAPTFDDITSTTEAAIAAMAQFKVEASGLEALLSRINSVAGSFAVEAGDIGVAIRRAGGAFQSAGGDIQELIALFTAVRSTTRESAETIATGFRTIFTRMQRPTTLKFLQQLGINLQDLSGKFVGPYEAVRRLNVALAGLDPRDVRYSQIVEQLGGFRQVSKVIPLIQQFDKAQAALNVSMAGGESLAEDAKTAQQSLAVQFTKTKESFMGLMDEIANDSAIRGMVEIGLKMAEAFITAVRAIKPLIPLLVSLAAIKIGAGMASFIGGRGAIRRGSGGGIPGVFGMAGGGLVPGKGNRDTVPAMLTPGEFVVTRGGVQSTGLGALHGINKYATGGPIKKKKKQRYSMADQPKQSGNIGDWLYENFWHNIGPGDAERRKRETDWQGGAITPKDSRRYLRRLSPEAQEHINKVRHDKWMEKREKSKVSRFAVGGAVRSFKSTTVNSNIKGPLTRTWEKDAGTAFKHGTHAFNEKDQVNFTYTPDDAGTSGASLFGGAATDTGVNKSNILLARQYVADKAVTDNPFGSRATAYEAMLKRNKMMTGTASTGGTQPFDGMLGNWWVEAKSTNSAINPTDIAGKALRQKLLGKDKTMGRMRTKPDIGPNAIDLHMNVKLHHDKDPKTSQLAVEKKIARHDERTRAAAVTTARSRVSGTQLPQQRSQERAKGGSISGAGTDTVPALLTPGEFVINKRSSKAYGYANLANLNKYAGGGMVTGGKHRYAGSRQGYISPAEVQSVTAKSKSAGGTRTRAGAKAAKDITIAQNKLVKELRKLHKEYGDEVVSLDQIEATRKQVEKNLKKQLASSERMISADKATASTKKTLDKALKNRTRAEEKAARRTGTGAGTPPGRGGGGEGMMMGVMAIGMASSTIASMVDAESTMGKIVNTGNEMIMMFMTMLMVGAQFGAMLTTATAKLGGFAASRGAALGKMLGPSLAVAAAGWALYNSLTKAAEASAKKAIMEGKSTAETQKGIAAAKKDAEFAGQSGGALMGAGAGAMIGTLIAPGIGTAIGAVIGGIAGYFVGSAKALDEFEKKVKKFKFEKATKDLNDALARVESGASPLADQINKIRVAQNKQLAYMNADPKILEETLKRIGKVLDKDFSQKVKDIKIPEATIVGQLEGLGSEADIAAKQSRISGEMIKRFSTLYGDQIHKLAVAEGITSKMWLDRKRKEADEMARAAIIQAQLTLAMKQMAEFLSEAHDVGAALRTMTDRVKEVSSAMDTLAAGFGGDYKGVSAGKITQLSARPEDIVDFSRFEKEVDRNAEFLRSTAGLGDDFVKELTQGTKESARVIREAPNVIRELGGKPLAPGVLGEKIVEGLNIDKSSVVGKELHKQILSILSDPKKARKYRDDPEAFAKELSKGRKEVFKVQQEAANLQNTHNAALAKMYTQRIEMENKIIQQQQKVIKMEQSREGKMAKLSGKGTGVSLGRAREMRQERVKAAMGKKGGFGSIAGVDPTVKGLTDKFRSLSDTIRMREDQAKRGLIVKDSELAKTAELIAQSKRTKEALKQLGDTAKEVAILESRLAKMRADREKKNSLLDDVLYGTDEERRDSERNQRRASYVNQQGVKAFEMMRSGKGTMDPMKNILQSNRGSVRDVFQKGSDLAIFEKITPALAKMMGMIDENGKVVDAHKTTMKNQGFVINDTTGQIEEFGRMTGTQALALNRATAVIANRRTQRGMAGLKKETPEQEQKIWKQLMGLDTDEELKILKSIDEGVRLQIAVNKEALKGMQSDAAQFGRMIAAENRVFLAELKKIMLMAEERRLKRKQIEAQKDLDVASAPLKVMKGLKQVGRQTGVKLEPRRAGKELAERKGDIAKIAELSRKEEKGMMFLGGRRYGQKGGWGAGGRGAVRPRSGAGALGSLAGFADPEKAGRNQHTFLQHRLGDKATTPLVGDQTPASAHKWDKMFVNLSKKRLTKKVGPDAQEVAVDQEQFKGFADQYDASFGTHTRAASIANMPQAALMGRMVRDEDWKIEQPNRLKRTESEVKQRRKEANKKFGAEGFKELQISEKSRVSDWSAAIFDQLQQGMTGVEKAELEGLTDPNQSNRIMGARTREERKELDEELGRKMTKRERESTSGVVQVGTRAEMERMLQGLQGQLGRAGDFLDAETVKSLQVAITKLGQEQQRAFKTPGGGGADSKHIINLQAYAKALTAINQAVKTEQVKAVEKPLKDLMDEFKNMAPELGRLNPRVLKDMAMALTQGEGVEGVRARAEAAGVTGSQVGGWENFEKQIMAWQQSFNLSQPEQFKQGIAGATQALIPFRDALTDATTAHKNIGTRITMADKAVTAAKGERALPVGAPGMLSSFLPAIQGAMKNAMPTLIPLLLPKLAPLLPKLAPLLPKLAPLLPKMTPLSSTGDGAGGGTEVVLANVSESLTSVKEGLETLMSVFAAMNKDASEFRVGATGPLMSKQNVEHKHDIAPMKLDLNLIGAQVFGQDHIVGPVKNYVEEKIGQVIRNEADKTGQLRDPSSTSNKPIGKK